MGQLAHRTLADKLPSIMAPPIPKVHLNKTLTLYLIYVVISLLCGALYIWPTRFAAIVVAIMFSWVAFLMHDYRCKVEAPSLTKALGMVCHTIPALYLYGTCHWANIAANSSDIWFASLMIFRYWRTLVQIFFWSRYNPMRPTRNDTMKPKDCTVLVPTVGPAGNSAFEDLIASILTNNPARVIFSTNTRAAAEGVETSLRTFRLKYNEGTTAYQLLNNIHGATINTDIQIINVGISSKRSQIVSGLAYVDTKILVCADDTAEWSSNWLREALAAFNDPKVGLVATRKWVKDLPAPTTSSADGILFNTWLRWYARFWNNMGGIYLTRHNFEIQSTNTADGGIFCVSGRSFLIRKEILNDEFQHAFTNEYVLGCGPVQPDDDNFVTRWVLKHGWRIKVQCQKEATMTTVLGGYPIGFKFFPSQCQRWSRSTFRQNPIALFIDRDIWWTWPLTVWTTYFPWMYNAALVWDFLALFVFTRTTFFATSSHPWLLLCTLVYLMQLTKMVKTAAWWAAHPLDFLLYFIIPAYPLFTYRHSIMKLHTAFTCLDLEWSGRKLPPAEKTI